MNRNYFPYNRRGNGNYRGRGGFRRYGYGNRNNGQLFDMIEGIGDYLYYQQEEKEERLRQEEQTKLRQSLEKQQQELESLKQETLKNQQLFILEKQKLELEIIKSKSLDLSRERGHVVSTIDKLGKAKTLKKSDLHDVEDSVSLLSIDDDDDVEEIPSKEIRNLSSIANKKFNEPPKRRGRKPTKKEEPTLKSPKKKKKFTSDEEELKSEITKLMTKAGNEDEFFQYFWEILDTHNIQLDDEEQPVKEPLAALNVLTSYLNSFNKKNTSRND